MSVGGQFQCRACGGTFLRNSDMHNNRHGRICIPCEKAWRREYKRRNADTIRENGRRYDLKVKADPILLHARRARYKRFRVAHRGRHTVGNLSRRAKQKGVPFGLSEADLDFSIICCPVLGIALRHNDAPSMPDSYSVDRITPSDGYVPGNVSIISNRANTIKNDAAPNEILAVAIYSYACTGHSVSDIHAAVDAIVAKQAEYRRINEAARDIDIPVQPCPA
jgi:hypothetical protein